MAVATIKKPLIGSFAKSFDISQSEIPRLKLTDTAVPVLELMELAGRVKSYTVQGSTNVTSTGSKTAAYPVPAGKRWRLHAVEFSAANGTWTTNKNRFCIRAGATVGAVSAFYSTTADILAGEQQVQLEYPIYLLPGDSVECICTVNSYTSGTGLLFVSVIVTEWNI